MSFEATAQETADFLRLLEWYKGAPAETQAKVVQALRDESAEAGDIFCDLADRFAAIAAERRKAA